MLRIAFIMPSWTNVFGGFSGLARKASSFPPLNLAMLAATVEQAGHSAIIIDAEIEGITVHEALRRLEQFSPDLVALTATTPVFHIASEWAHEVRQRLKVPVAIGGFHITLFGQEAFHEHFDFAFLGEADLSFRDFLTQFGGARRYEEVKGLLFRKDDRVVSTGVADPAQDLDALPLPARHLLKVDLYRVGTMQGEKNYTSIMTTRGCPFRCVFCSNRVGGLRVRKRSVGNVVEEIRQVVDTINVRHFYFVDDVLTLDRVYMLELCTTLAAAGLSITFEGSTRANLLDDELVDAMQKAGLVRLSLGLETADEAVRAIIKKEVPLESYPIANRILNKYGIETINSVMLGLPGDTRASIETTIRYLRRAREIKHATFGIAMPYPGTELYEMAMRGEHGLKLLTQDFSRYQRYGSAVMEVNGLTPEALLRLQKTGLVRIYSVPWRFLPMMRRMGIKALIAPAISALSALLADYMGKILPCRRS